MVVRDAPNSLGRLDRDQEKFVDSIPGAFEKTGLIKDASMHHFQRGT